MSFSLCRYRLAARALQDMRRQYEALGQPCTAEDYDRSYRKLELIDRLIDRPEEEKDSLMVLAVLLFGGPRNIDWATFDPAPYLKKYNAHVHKMLCTMKDMYVNNTAPSADYLQVEAVSFIRLLEHYRDKVSQNPNAFAGRQASFNSLADCFVGDAPHPARDPAMPSLTTYAREVREELRAALKRVPQSPILKNR